MGSSCRPGADRTLCPGRAVTRSPHRLAALALILGWLSAADYPPRASAQADKEGSTSPRTDAYGDPLSPGALAHMGAIRYRHGSNVWFVTFLPEDKMLAAEGSDHSIRLWDVTTAKEIATLKGHKAISRARYFSPTVASTCPDFCVGQEPVRAWWSSHHDRMRASESCGGRARRRFGRRRMVGTGHRGVEAAPS